MFLTIREVSVGEGALPKALHLYLKGAQATTNIKSYQA